MRALNYRPPREPAPKPVNPSDYVAMCTLCREPIYGPSWNVLVQSAIRHGAVAHGGAHGQR